MEEVCSTVSQCPWLNKLLISYTFPCLLRNDIPRELHTYQGLRNICPFSAARHPLSATRPTAWWMELMDIAACLTAKQLLWHIKEREGDRETKRQRDNLEICSTLPAPLPASIWRTETRSETQYQSFSPLAWWLKLYTIKHHNGI